MKPVLNLAFVFCLLTGSWQSQAVQNAADSEQLVLNMVREMTSAPEGGPGWMASNIQRVTPDLADLADKLAQTAYDNFEMEAAIHRWAFASLAHRGHREPYKSLKSFFDSQNATFLGGRSAEIFEGVHENALQIEKVAEHNNQPDLLFVSEVLQAECSLFASENENDTLLAQNQIIGELSETVRALSNEKYAPDRFWRERLVKLLNELSTRTMHRLVPQPENREEVDALLKQIAAGSERAIPVDFETTLVQHHHLGPMNRRESIRTAMALADLSFVYGSTTSGEARISLAASRARSSHDIDLWAAITAATYERWRTTHVSSVQLRQLSEQLRSADGDLRAMFRSRAGRIWSGYQADVVYGTLLQHELEENSLKAEEIFFAVESLKARTLLDAMEFSPTLDSISSPSSDLERRIIGFSPETESHLESDTLLLRQFLPGVPPIEGKNDVMMNELKLCSQLTSFDNKLGSAEPRQEALQGLEALITKMGGGFRDVATPASLAEVQRALSAKEALLEYVIPYNWLGSNPQLWILLITRNRFQLAHVLLDQALPSNKVPVSIFQLYNQAPLDLSPLNQLLIRMRTSIRVGRDQDAKNDLRTLYTILIQPLEQEGAHLEDFDQITIVPHGALHYVPFAALLDSHGEYLISRMAVSLVPSASVWLALTKRDGPVARLVALGAPDLKRPDADDLSYAKEELADISQRVSALKPETFIGKNATEDQFAKAAPLTNILHISTHGDFPDDDALNLHALWLAKGAAGDGVVRASTVRKLKLPYARLVTLSICNGGLYRIGPADEPYGLVPAFLEAGAQNVLGTLWQLDDEFGRDFMREFYTHVLHDGPAKSLQKTSIHFVNNNEDLRHWAGFVLVGPGHPFTNSAQFSHSVQSDKPGLAPQFGQASAGHYELSLKARKGTGPIVLSGHNGPVRTAVFSPDGQLVITGSDDGTARIWNASTGQLVIKLESHFGGVLHVEFSQDGQRVVTSSSNASQTWSAVDGKLLATFKGSSNATFSPDGHRIVAPNTNGVTQIWDAATGRELVRLGGQSATALEARFSPDGQRLVTINNDGTADVWDGTTGKSLVAIRPKAAFSLDLQRLLTTTVIDGATTVQVWSAPIDKDQLLAEIKVDGVQEAKFSPDGNRILTINRDDLGQIWDAASGKLLGISKDLGIRPDATFSPDGQRLATTSVGNATRVWDASNWHLVASLEGHSGRALTAAFSPDSRRIVTASVDLTARIWNIDAMIVDANPTGSHAKRRAPESFSNQQFAALGCTRR